MPRWQLATLLILAVALALTISAGRAIEAVIIVR
jgi:hypothetical protein